MQNNSTPPVYKVVSEFPDNKDFPLGKIIDFHPWVSGSMYWEHTVSDCQGERSWLEDFFKKYPLIFRRIDMIQPVEVQTFEDYMRNSRDEFVGVINSHERSVTLKVACEDLLICFDQMREKILAQPVEGDKQPVKEMDITGETTVVEIEQLLREFYTKNKDGKGGGYGRRLISQVIQKAADASRLLSLTPTSALPDKQESEDDVDFRLLAEYDMSDRLEKVLTHCLTKMPEENRLKFITNLCNGMIGSAILHHHNRYVKNLTVTDFRTTFK